MMSAAAAGERRPLIEDAGDELPEAEVDVARIAAPDDPIPTASAPRELTPGDRRPGLGLGHDEAGELRPVPLPPPVARSSSTAREENVELGAARWCPRSDRFCDRH